MVLQATCLLFGHDETWENAKRFLLSDMRFLEKLVEFDVSNTSENRFIKLKNNYLGREDFKKELVVK